MKSLFAALVLVVSSTLVYAQDTPVPTPTPPPSVVPAPQPPPTPEPPQPTVEVLTVKQLSASTYHFHTAPCQQLQATASVDDFENTDSISGGTGQFSFQVGVNIYDTCRNVQVASGWGTGTPFEIQVNFGQSKVVGTVEFDDYVTHQHTVLEVRIDWDPTNIVAAKWDYKDDTRDEVSDVASHSIGRRGSAQAKAYISDGIHIYAADDIDYSATLSEFVGHETLIRLPPTQQ